MKTIIINSGPLMALGKLNRLELLVELYGQIQIPNAVYTETVIQGITYGASDALTIKLFLQYHNLPIIEVSTSTLASYIPSVMLDRGERELLALAQTVSEPFVILDEEIARAEARRLNIPVHGTLGVLVQAYKKALLSFNQIQFLFEEIAIREDIWISAKLCKKVLNSLSNSTS